MAHTTGGMAEALCVATNEESSWVVQDRGGFRYSIVFNSYLG